MADRPYYDIKRLFHLKEEQSDRKRVTRRGDDRFVVPSVLRGRHTTAVVVVVRSLLKEVLRNLNIVNVQ